MKFPAALATTVTEKEDEVYIEQIDPSYDQPLIISLTPEQAGAIGAALTNWARAHNETHTNELGSTGLFYFRGAYPEQCGQALSSLIRGRDSYLRQWAHASTLGIAPDVDAEMDLMISLLKEVDSDMSKKAKTG